MLSEKLWNNINGLKTLLWLRVKYLTAALLRKGKKISDKECLYIIYTFSVTQNCNTYGIKVCSRHLMLIKIKNEIMVLSQGIKLVLQKGCVSIVKGHKRQML